MKKINERVEQTSSEREEMIQLRAENERLEEEARQASIEESQKP